MEHQRATKSAQKEQPKVPSSSQHQTSLNRVATHPLLELQRTIGNQAVLNLLRSRNMQSDTTTHTFREPRFSHDFSQIPIHSPATEAIQTKLAINQPGGEYEREADRIADQVLAPPAHPAVSGVTPHIQRFAGQLTGQTDTGSPSVDYALARPGRPLELALRQDMEQRFGYDFSRVRVHTDSQIADALGAKAFTSGLHIWFPPGRGPSDHSLLAHEIAHVVQQATGEANGLHGAGGDASRRETLESRADHQSKRRDDVTHEPIRPLPVPPLTPAVLQFDIEAGKAERVLEFVAKWGRNASPFKIAYLYVKLNWKGLNYWKDVSKAARAGRDLLKRIDGLERGARALKKATDEQSSAESKLPSYPLQTFEKAGHMMITDAELDYVEKYFNTAAIIANDAMSARSELDKAIAGWDDVVDQANKTNDFTRAAAWEAITDLDLRFNNEGGNFRAYLVNMRDTAARVEDWARLEQYHGADILGKWTPPWYKAPTPK